MNYLFPLRLNVKKFNLIHRSGVTTSDQSRTGSDGNERVLHIPQIYKDGASAADGLM